jgi:CIC family chloride channel protein
MTGMALAGLVGLEWPMARADTLTLAVVGMSACLGAVVGAPVTGILIVFEMTHEFALVPVLMIGALVSQAISRKINRENFYDALLTQDGHHIEHVRPPRDLQSWQQFPVSAIANFRPVIIHDLAPAKLQDFLKSHPYQKSLQKYLNNQWGKVIRKSCNPNARTNPPSLIWLCNNAVVPTMCSKPSRARWISARPRRASPPPTVMAVVQPAASAYCCVS